MLRHIFDCYNWVMLLAISWQRPRMLLNIYSAQNNSPAERVTTKMSIVSRLRSPDLWLDGSTTSCSEWTAGVTGLPGVPRPGIHSLKAPIKRAVSQKDRVTSLLGLVSVPVPCGPLPGKGLCLYSREKCFHRVYIQQCYCWIGSEGLIWPCQIS